MDEKGEEVFQRTQKMTGYFTSGEGVFEERIKEGESKIRKRKLQIKNSQNQVIIESELVEYGVEYGTRIFFTSIPNVLIRAEANTQGEVLKELEQAKTEIKVTGKAVKGEYIDSMKTDRWYPVRYWKGLEEGVEGYVIGTSVHAEWVEMDLLDAGDDNYWTSYHKKTVGVKKEAIILHFTANNGTPKNERDNMNKIDISASTHYIIGRDGKILQAVNDFNTAHHARPDNPRSIGIEIVGWGSL